MSFPFESLDVYKRAIQFIAEIETLLERERVRLSRSIADQLSRAALSIPLNIAEGNGRWHKGDKRNFFWIARGSVFECIPILEVLKIKKLITEQECNSYRAQLEVIGKMLTRLSQVHSEKPLER
jgi:four helix bundle protein